MSLVLIIAALLPAAILMVYVYRKDKVEKEPKGLVARVFVLGMVAGPLAAIVENILFGVFDALVPAGMLLLVLQYFVGVAAVEEGFKYLAVLTVRRHSAFNYVFDGIVYAVAAALGFAALENVLYVIDGGLEVAVTRALFSVPGHCADGVVMGCFFGLAKQREHAGEKAAARTNYWLAFILPTIEHGFYDCALSTESDLMVLLALAVDIAFVVFAMILVNRISKNDAPFVPVAAGQAPARPVQQPDAGAQAQQPVAAVQQPAQPVQQPPMAQPGRQSGEWVCPHCNTANAGNFCGECGAKRPL